MGTRRAHGLTPSQTSRSNLTQKLIWVLGDKIIDLLRVFPLLVPFTTLSYTLEYVYFVLILILIFYFTIVISVNFIKRKID